MAAARAKRQNAAKRSKSHGGKRAGAGRPQEKLPDTLLAELGNPPLDPLKKTEWWNRLLEILQYGVLKGLPWVTMLRDARSNALVASKLVPEEIKNRAAAIIEQEDRDAEADASPRVTKRKEDPIAAANAGALRRDPS